MDTIIVGGGIAGLCCAKTLHEAGRSFVILEAADRVGGRIATDEVDGFLLDRGFQVFLTSYEEAKRVLDYDALDLKAFEPGALTYHAGKLHRLSDPLRRPQHFLATAFSAAAEMTDKVKVKSLSSEVARGTVSDLYEKSEQKTFDRLKEYGFSDTVMERFFRPFLGGVFLESELATSSRMFDFVFRMFGEGDATLPASGMGAIPKQVADRLPSDSIRLNTRVQSIADQTVTLESGETLTASQIVVAADNPSACQLADTPKRDGQGVTCVYFSTEKVPVDEPILILNGERTGPINNLCFPHLVSKEYAPANKALVSVTVLADDQEDTLNERIVAQMQDWFGSDFECQHLKTYRIPFALPSQVSLEPVEKSPLLREGLYRCGDDMDTASINGAMASGRRVAEAILGTFG